MWKEISEGIVIIFATKDNKIGLAVGVTDKLTKKYDAVKRCSSQDYQCEKISIEKIGIPSMHLVFMML